MERRYIFRRARPEDAGDIVRLYNSKDVYKRQHQPILNDPQRVEQADYLVLESTYGNRLHGELSLIHISSQLPGTVSYKYGAEVRGADKATAPGYTVDGWRCV